MANETDPLRDVAASATKSLGKAVGSFQKWAKNSEQSFQSWASTIDDRDTEDLPPPPGHRSPEIQPELPPPPVKRRLAPPDTSVVTQPQTEHSAETEHPTEIEHPPARWVAPSEPGPAASTPGPTVATVEDHVEPETFVEPVRSAEEMAYEDAVDPSLPEAAIAEEPPAPAPQPRQAPDHAGSTKPAISEPADSAVSDIGLVVSAGGFVLPPPPAPLDLPPLPVWESLGVSDQ